jgi:hypothetical protein
MSVVARMIHILALGITLSHIRRFRAWRCGSRQLSEALSRQGADNCRCSLLNSESGQQGAFSNRSACLRPMVLLTIRAPNIRRTISKRRHVLHSAGGYSRCQIARSLLPIGRRHRR